MCLAWCRGSGPRFTDGDASSPRNAGPEHRIPDKPTGRANARTMTGSAKQPRRRHSGMVPTGRRFAPPDDRLRTRPQTRNCASGNLEIPGSMLRIAPEYGSLDWLVASLLAMTSLQLQTQL